MNILIDKFGANAIKNTKCQIDINKSNCQNCQFFLVVCQYCHSIKTVCQFIKVWKYVTKIKLEILTYLVFLIVSTFQKLLTMNLLLFIHVS